MKVKRCLFVRRAEDVSCLHQVVCRLPPSNLPSQQEFSAGTMRHHFFLGGGHTAMDIAPSYSPPMVTLDRPNNFGSRLLQSFQIRFPLHRRQTVGKIFPGTAHQAFQEIEEAYEPSTYQNGTAIVTYYRCVVGQGRPKSSHEN